MRAEVRKERPHRVSGSASHALPERADEKGGAAHCYLPLISKLLSFRRDLQWAP